MDEQSVKEKILNGAIELFMKYGVRSISMDDIARHLSVSKKTLYQHFIDKEDLVTLAAEVHTDGRRKHFEDLSVNAVNAIDELAKISITLRKDISEMNPSLLFDLKKYHPRAWSIWLDRRNNYIKDFVARNIRQGIDEGYFRPEINAEILALLRFESIHLALDEQIFPRDRFSLTEVQLQIFDHFVYGLCTEKGRDLYKQYKAQHKL